MTTIDATPPSLEELAELSASFEQAPPNDIIRWAGARFGEGLVFTASFEDAVLVDLVARSAPSTEIVLLDTQYLFAETQWFAEELRRRYDLRLTIVHPLPDVTPDNRWQTDLEGCCGVRKVEPLARALAGRTAWITGVRRVDAPTRANAPIVSYDIARQVVKINPLATWTDEQVALYEELEQLPRHPLVERGYASIGCWPCTRPVAPGEDRRAGRWAGAGKVECGLHQ
jgi:phosphoadenosine phosphosulfate reductase